MEQQQGYRPTQDDLANLAEVLFWIRSGLQPAMVMFTTSREGANWIEGELAARGHAGIVQYVVTPTEYSAPNEEACRG